MRIFKTRWFVRFARRSGVADVSLLDAIRRIERGLIDADLGDGLVKQRIARPGQGRSGGFRVLVAYRQSNKAVFMYGFAKNERESISSAELETLRDVAKAWFDTSPDRLAVALKNGSLQEVNNGNQEDEPLG